MQTTPGTVVGLTNVASVTTGGSFTCAEMTTGNVRCWGFNGGGQLGNGTTTSSATPVQIPGLTGVVAVRAGTVSACAVLGSGSLRCWGSEYNGGLGNGGALTDQLTSPTTVAGLTTVKSVAVGTSHTCAQLANNSARCWGRNYQMQLGTGDADPSGTGKDRAAPAAVVGVP